MSYGHQIFLDIILAIYTWQKTSGHFTKACLCYCVKSFVLNRLMLETPIPVVSHWDLWICHFLKCFINIARIAIIKVIPLCSCVCCVNGVVLCGVVWCGLVWRGVAAWRGCEKISIGPGISSATNGRLIRQGFMAGQVTIHFTDGYVRSLSPVCYYLSWKQLLITCVNYLWYNYAEH